MQLIPAGTILKGRNSVSVITDAQAIIPPAAQTTPPTYGQTSVAAHALVAGTTGNIAAGDINELCCVTSVIAQNPYPFTGGRDARDYTYLTQQDVSQAIAENVTTLEAAAQAHFASPIVLEPHCSTTSKIYPAVGQEAATVRLTLKAVCTGISYSRTLAKNQITKAGMQYGQLTSVQFAIVGIMHKQGAIMLRVYVTAVVRPIVHIPIR